MSAASKSLSRDDHDPCCALQPVFSGKLPGVDGHHIGLRRCLDAVSMQSCFMGAPQPAEWMKQHPAERLAAWRCVSGNQNRNGA